MLFLVTLEPTEARCMVRNELAEEGTSVDVILYKISLQRNEHGAGFAAVYYSWHDALGAPGGRKDSVRATIRWFRVGRRGHGSLTTIEKSVYLILRSAIEML